MTATRERVRQAFGTKTLNIPIPMISVFGLNEAIVLQQIVSWCEWNEEQASSHHFKDGFYWMYNSYPDWKKRIPCWSEKTLYRIIRSLEKKDLIISRKYASRKADHSKWYRPSYANILKAFTDKDSSYIGGQNDYPLTDESSGPNYIGGQNVQAIDNLKNVKPALSKDLGSIGRQVVHTLIPVNNEGGQNNYQVELENDLKPLSSEDSGYIGRQNDYPPIADSENGNNVYQKRLYWWTNCPDRYRTNNQQTKISNPDQKQNPTASEPLVGSYASPSTPEPEEVEEQETIEDVATASEGLVPSSAIAPEPKIEVKENDWVKLSDGRFLFVKIIMPKRNGEPGDLFDYQRFAHISEVVKVFPAPEDTTEKLALGLTNEQVKVGDQVKVYGQWREVESLTKVGGEHMVKTLRSEELFPTCHIVAIKSPVAHPEAPTTSVKATQEENLPLGELTPSRDLAEPTDTPCPPPPFEKDYYSDEDDEEACYDEEDDDLLSERWEGSYGGPLDDYFAQRRREEAEEEGLKDPEEENEQFWDWEEGRMVDPLDLDYDY